LAIDRGTFRLTVTKDAVSATTDFISWNARANAEDEVPADIESDLFNTGGSMQSHLQSLVNIQNVRVSRQDLNLGSFVWTVTFLDPGDITSVTVASSSVGVSDGTTVTTHVTPFKVTAGEVYASCTGAQEISPLVEGTPYYVRVFAYNKIGFGPPVTSAIAYKPMIPPSLPTTVSLTSYTGTSLLVGWSAPLSPGGDAAMTYRCVCAPISSWYRALFMSVVDCVCLFVCLFVFPGLNGQRSPISVTWCFTTF
jgi:hypothetical protein